MKKIVAILMAMLMMMSVTVALAGGAATTKEKQSEKVPVIIMFKDKTDKDLIKQHGGEIKCVYQIKPALAVSLPQKAIDALKKNPKIDYIVPDLEVFTMAETLDWGVDRIDADIVHEYNRGTGVKVAIMDTGIDYNHLDLAANYKGGYDFGGLFFGIINDDDPMDFHGHGTHCAGIVAAVKGNDIGVIGVAPEAHLYAVKVFDDFGYCLYSDVIEGLEWCINNDIQVISMSFGSAYTAGDPGIEPWINDAYDAGILLVGAAGNEGSGEDTVIYPARYANVIAVAATTDINDDRASFSSTGPTVELSAPGVNIKSTYLNNAYVYMSGTSMACPHVTGTAALALAADQNLSNVKVRKWLRATAEDLGEPGKDNAYGYGLVDAENATSPRANETPPIIKILSPSDGSTYVTINRSLIWITDEPCAWAAYSLNGTENDTITGNTTFTAQNGTNNLILYCNDSVGNIGSATTNFTVDETILYRFVQITDSHVDSSPLNVDYGARIISHSVEILEDTLDEIRYRYDPNTIILTGDITDKGTEEDLKLSETILNERAENWSVVAGNHDVLKSLNNFLTVFDERNWSFVDENSGSLFVGIDSSEGCSIVNPEGNVSEDQIAFLNDTLSEYANTGKIAFVFMHHTLQNVSDCLIKNADEVNALLWSHTGNYRKIVQLCGHVHLNNRTDENNVTYLVTSALVSYPMEYRIVDIRANSINMTMGGPAHPEYANLSLGEGASRANYGTDFDRIVDIDITTTQAPPIITSLYPIEMVVNNTEGEPRTFNIKVDQTVNVSWLINGTKVFSESGVTNSTYTNMSAAIGIWNVSAIATNVTTGLSDMQTWIWNVIPPDIAPPASITDLSESAVGETWINWTWTNPTDADFNHTMVFLNGTWEINTSNPFYNATGLAPDTYYEIGTHTVGKVGNINTTWVNQMTKTKAGPDTTPPIITFVPPTPANNSEVNVNHVFVNVTTNEPCNTAILNWNGSNETMRGSGMNFYLNKTSLSNGIYSFKVYANDTANNWNVSETRIVEVIGYIDAVANAEETVKGTRTGSYAATNASDDVYEAITEIVRGPRSLIEHKWTIDVTGGSSVIFYVEANHTVNSEGDDFVFAYSTDGSTYTDMVTVTNTSGTDTYQTYKMPKDTSGTVYIRVMDTDRTKGNKTLDTIYIDHIFIRSESGPPSYGVTVTIDEASQTVAPGNSTTYTVRTKNTGDLNASYTVNMSGTAVNEPTITVSPLNWNTDTLAPNAENVTTVTVSTDSSTPEETYTLTATATCDQDASVTDSATSELVVSSLTKMHIHSINMSLKTAGINTNGIALVTIVNATGAPVEGATVEGHWSDATTDTDSGSTDASGEVALDSDKVRNAPSGTNFTFTVDNVSLTGWEYDPASNAETSDSIPVP